MAVITPPGGWHCTQHLLPGDGLWVWVCLRSMGCCKCCKAVKAQFQLNGGDCNPPPASTLTNPDCTATTASFMVPVPMCGDTDDPPACHLMYVPWFEVCKWGAITDGNDCGDTTPGTLPCVLPA